MPGSPFDVCDERRVSLDGRGHDPPDVRDAAAQAEEIVVDLAREILPDGRERDFGWPWGTRPSRLAPSRPPGG